MWRNHFRAYQFALMYVAYPPPCLPVCANVCGVPTSLPTSLHFLHIGHAISVSLRWFIVAQSFEWATISHLCVLIRWCLLSWHHLRQHRFRSRSAARFYARETASITGNGWTGNITKLLEKYLACGTSNSLMHICLNAWNNTNICIVSWNNMK